MSSSAQADRTQHPQLLGREVGCPPSLLNFHQGSRRKQIPDQVELLSERHKGSSAIFCALFSKVVPNVLLQLKNLSLPRVLVNMSTRFWSTLRHKGHTAVHVQPTPYTALGTVPKIGSAKKFLPLAPRLALWSRRPSWCRHGPRACPCGNANPWDLLDELV